MEEYSKQYMEEQAEKYQISVNSEFMELMMELVKPSGCDERAVRISVGMIVSEISKTYKGTKKLERFNIEVKRAISNK